MSKRTTVVLDTWDALHALLDEQTWPVHPVTVEQPKVIFGDAPNYPTEAIVVLGTTGRTNTEWATMGAPSRDEDFALQVGITSRVSGTTRQAATARLGVLAAVVENAVRSDTTGRPIGGFETTVPGVLWWGVAGFLPQIVSTEEGFIARAEIDINFHARI